MGRGSGFSPRQKMIKKPIEIAEYVFCTHKKITSRTIRISGTLLVRNNQEEQQKIPYMFSLVFDRIILTWDYSIKVLQRRAREHLAGERHWLWARRLHGWDIRRWNWCKTYCNTFIVRDFRQTLELLWKCTIIFLHMLGRMDAQLIVQYACLCKCIMLGLLMHCVVTHLHAHAVSFIESRFRVHC